MAEPYRPETHTRADVDRLQGAAVLEFGTNWCGICQAAQPVIDRAFADYPQLARIKVEDGSGRPLGRSYRVKLWPTLVFLSNGQELSRLVRPRDVDDISRAIGELVAAQQAGG